MTSLETPAPQPPTQTHTYSPPTASHLILAPLQLKNRKREKQRTKGRKRLKFWLGSFFVFLTAEKLNTSLCPREVGNKQCWYFTLQSLWSRFKVQGSSFYSKNPFEGYRNISRIHTHPCVKTCRRIFPYWLRYFSYKNVWKQCHRLRSLTKSVRQCHRPGIVDQLFVSLLPSAHLS